MFNICLTFLLICFYLPNKIINLIKYFVRKPRLALSPISLYIFIEINVILYSINTYLFNE